MKLDTIIACPADTIKVPIKATNYTSVGSISAVYHYDPAVLTYLSYTYKSMLNTGFLVLNGAIPGTISMAWYSTTPLNLVYDSIVTVKFLLIGGTTNLVWDMSICEITMVSGAQIPTNFIDGRVTDAPNLAHINSNPVSITECIGDTVAFHITSSNTTFIQWQVSTDNGANWSNLSNNSMYSGVFTNDLTVSGITLGMNNYKYRCAVRGYCPPSQVPYVISSVATLTVNSPPLVDAGNNFGICSGLTASLTGTASNNTTVNWTSSSGNTAFAGNGTLTPVYTPNAGDITAGSVKLYLTASPLTGCVASKDSMLLTIYPIPVAFADDDTTICKGGTAYLVGSGGTSFIWSTTPQQTTPMATVSPLVNTTYTLTVSQNGCTDTDIVQVFVIPVPTVNAGIDDTICEGQNAVLVGTATAYSALNWQSSGTGTWSDQNSLNTDYTPSAADIAAGLVEIYLFATPDAPCTELVSDTLLLIITGLPHVYAGIDKNICIGDTATLIASGASNYSWNTTPLDVNDTILVHPNVTTSYILTGFEGNCSATDTVVVNVNMLPVVFAGNDTTICFGTTANLIATGGNTYIWSTGSPTPVVSVSPVSTTTYTVTATGAFGCENTDNVIVIVNSNLTVSISPTSPVICAGDSVELNAMANLPVSYQWTPTLGLSSSTTSSVTASPFMTTDYEVLVKDNNYNCTAKAFVTVNVNQNPIVQVHPSAITICEQDTLTLSAYGALNYYWSPPTGLSSNTMPTVMASPMDSISYLIIGTDIHGCVDSFQVTINVNKRPHVDIPTSTILCRGANFLLDAGAYLDSCDYLWQDGSERQFFYASEPGTYAVIVSKLGCIATDSTVIYPCSELFVPNAFSPNNDGRNDVFFVVNSGDVVKFHMVIYNKWGETVFQTTDINEGWDGNFKGSRSPVGVYHYVIEYLGQGNVLLEQEGKQYGQITLFR